MGPGKRQTSWISEEDMNTLPSEATPMEPRALQKASDGNWLPSSYVKSCPLARELCPRQPPEVVGRSCPRTFVTTPLTKSWVCWVQKSTTQIPPVTGSSSSPPGLANSCFSTWLAAMPEERGGVKIRTRPSYLSQSCWPKNGERSGMSDT